MYRVTFNLPSGVMVTVWDSVAVSADEAHEAAKVYAASVYGLSCVATACQWFA